MSANETLTLTICCNESGARIDTSNLKIQINPLDVSHLSGAEGAYSAHAIEINGRYYYSALDRLVEISKQERDSVISNPKLYYFSTALRLHNRIKGQVATSINSNGDVGGCDD